MDFFREKCKQSIIMSTISFLKYQKSKVFMLGVWSSGMIPASGAGGPEFNSRNAPFYFCLKKFGVFSGLRNLEQRDCQCKRFSAFCCQDYYFKHHCLL